MARLLTIHDVTRPCRGDTELAGMPALSDMNTAASHPDGEAKLVTEFVTLCTHEASRSKRVHADGADGHRRCCAALTSTASVPGLPPRVPQQSPLISRGLGRPTMLHLGGADGSLRTRGITAPLCNAPSGLLTRSRLAFV